MDNDLSQATEDQTRVPAEEARGLSLLRKAEKQRAEQTEDLYLDVPSWAGDLVGAYRVVDRPALEMMARKAQAASRSGDTSEATRQDIAFILRANVGFYVYDPEATKQTPEAVYDRDSDRFLLPVKDDLGLVNYSRITEILKDITEDAERLEDLSRVKSAEEAVLYAFKANDVAIRSHSMTIARYMRDPSKGRPLGEL